MERNPELEQVGFTISPTILREFRQTILNKYGKTFGHQSQSLEEAINLWILHETNPKELLEKLKQKVETHD